jgi:ribosomal protein S18 acetylase RimI-like enzyme
MASRRPRSTRGWLAALLASGAPGGLVAFVATEADVPELARLSLEAFGDQALIPAGLFYYLNQGHALVFGLKQGSSIVSYCVIELNDGMRRIYVVETFTRAAVRGRGLGSWLRARVEDVGIHLRYRYIASHVAVTNMPARRLNEKAGLEVVRRIERYYDDGRDGLYLRKTLELPAPAPATAKRAASPKR